MGEIFDRKYVDPEIHEVPLLSFFLLSVTDFIDLPWALGLCASDNV